jgi:hypothetical protein
MVAKSWGDHIAGGQISSCSRRTGNDTQTANGGRRRRRRRKKKTKRKKKKVVLRTD